MTLSTRRSVAGAGALVGAFLLTCSPIAARAADEVEFTITTREITESSGLARDTTNGHYWTVNDSGDGGTVYGIDPDGGLRGTLDFRAQPVDVEAVAVDNDRLYVADIGDNQAQRAFVTVYFFDDPVADDSIRSYRALDFSYPDGPHDAESLLVDPTGRLYIVTKEAKGGVYAAPNDPRRQGVNPLERVGDAPAYVTDGVFLPDGAGIALRTYTSVEVVDATSYAVTARAATPRQPQGESIAVSLDGTSLLLGSEGKKSKVFRVEIPTAVNEVPEASASPPPSASASPSSSATRASSDAPTSRDAEEDPNAGRSRAGTFLALGLAAMVAVVAGVVVGLVRKP